MFPGEIKTSIHVFKRDGTEKVYQLPEPNTNRKTRHVSLQGHDVVVEMNPTWEKTAIVDRDGVTNMSLRFFDRTATPEGEEGSPILAAELFGAHVVVYPQIDASIATVRSGSASAVATLKDELQTNGLRNQNVRIEVSQGVES